MKLKSPTSRMQPNCSLLVRCATAHSAMKPYAPAAGHSDSTTEVELSPFGAPIGPHFARLPGQPRGSPQPGAESLHAGCDVAGAATGFMFLAIEALPEEKRNNSNACPWEYPLNDPETRRISGHPAIKNEPPIALLARFLGQEPNTPGSWQRWRSFCVALAASTVGRLLLADRGSRTAEQLRPASSTQDTARRRGVDPQDSVVPTGSACPEAACPSGSERSSGSIPAAIPSVRSRADHTG